METFLVTGASGYIASWIVKFLLEQGAHVHGTVRSLSDKNKIGHLLDMQQKFPDQLRLFEADLLNKDSFRQAMEGCTIVLHTASPFFITKIKDPQRDLIQPALEGTRNILTLAGGYTSVKRIIVTSSAAAVYGDAAEISQVRNNRFDEENWNTTSNESYNPYQYSKTLAEKEAWKIAESQQQWSLATINPGFVMGPSLSKRVDSTSIDTMRSLLNGKYNSGVPNLFFGIVDVRDVAHAHILAARQPGAAGRHICVGHCASIMEMAQILRDKYRDKPIPKSLVPKFLLYLVGPLMGFSWKFHNLNYGIEYRFDNSKSIRLGVQYSPLEITLADHAAQLIRDGLV